MFHRYVFKKLETIAVGEAADPEQSKRIASSIRRRVVAKRRRNQRGQPDDDDSDLSVQSPVSRKRSQQEVDCMGDYFHVHDVAPGAIKRPKRAPSAGTQTASSSSAAQSDSNLTLNGSKLVRKPAKVQALSFFTLPGLLL